MAHSYDYYLLNMKKWCEEFKQDILKIVFKRKEEIGPEADWICYAPRYQNWFQPIKRSIEICDLLGIQHLEINKSYLLQRINWLAEPEEMHLRSDFVKNVDDIGIVFGEAQEELKKKFSKLEGIEIDRLNEAIDTFLEDCYCSTVAMSVCAVENRLLKLMSEVCPQEKEKLEKITLGELIGEYLQNKDKYQSVVPKKYEGLLNNCNQFRTFAVHPKGERMTKAAAQMILSSTFEFLLG